MDDSGGWEEQFRKELGKKIKRWCRSKKPMITEEQLGVYMDLSTKTISDIYCGRKTLNDREIGLLSMLTGWPGSDFTPIPPDDWLDQQCEQAGISLPAERIKKRRSQEQAFRCYSYAEMINRQMKLHKLLDDMLEQAETIEQIDGYEQIMKGLGTVVTSSVNKK